MTAVLLLIQVAAEHTWRSRRTIAAVVIETFVCLLFLAAFVAIIVGYGYW